MTANKINATPVQDQLLRKNNFTGLRSPGLLARRPFIGSIMFIFGILIFGGLTYNLLANGPLLGWDKVIANTLPAIGLKSAPFVKSFMDAGFYIGDQVVIGLSVLLGVYFIIKRYWQELAMLAIGLAGSSLLFLSLSNLIDRARPVNQIWIVEKIPGFPSGHSITVVAFYGLLAYLLIPKMPSTFWKGFVIGLALLIIAFVGFSRIFTGGHYLTDVLAGYAIGIAWSGLAYTVIEIYSQKRKVKNAKKE